MKPKVIVVTGANKGIGFEIAWQLAKDGHAIILTARDANKGKQANEKLANQGWKTIFIQLDVTKSADIQNLRDCIEEHFGHLDVLINNAAILHGDEDSVHVSKDSVQKHLETNFLTGPERSSPNRSSPQNETTVGLSSTAAVTISAMTPPYIM